MYSPDYQEPEWLLPFEFMKVGDSFFIPTLKPAQLLYILDTRAKVVGIRVRCYPAAKDGCMGVRVWRTR
jgi:hypothetical protein